MPQCNMDRLKKALLLLRNAEPEVFGVFINEFAKHVEDVTVAVTEAPVEDVLVCQGRAQEARRLLRDFVELPATDAGPSQSRAAVM